MGKVQTIVKKLVNEDILNQMYSSRKDLAKVLAIHRGEESSDTPSRLMRGKPGKLLARRLQCKLCFTNFCLNVYTRESVHLQPEKFEPVHAVNERNSVW